MRRSNLLKVMSVVMVVAMLMLSTTSAFAAVTAVQSITDTTVTIEGAIDGAPYASNVTITVLKPGVTEADIKAMEEGGAAWDYDKFIAAGSAIVGAGGAFECTLKLEDNDSMPNGEYLVIVSPTIDGVALADRSATFAFVTTRVKADKLKEIVLAATNLNLANKIEEHKAVLSIDSTMWDLLVPTPVPSSVPSVIPSELQLKAAVAIIDGLAPFRANIGSLTLNDLPAINDVITNESYAQLVAGGVVSDINDLGNYVDIEDYKDLLLPTKIDPAVVDAFPGQIIGSGADDLAALEELYKQKVLLAGVVNPLGDSTAISREFLDKFASDIGLTNASIYLNLTDTFKQTVADACRRSGATNFDELNTAFSSAITGLVGSGPVTTPKPGSTTGNGGGSTTTLTPPTVSTPVPPTAKPDDDAGYTDIDDVEWAWEAIRELSKRKIFAGYGDGTFGPNDAILREEFIKIAVVGLFGEESVDPSAVPSFTDAQTGWFVPYVAAAEKNNFTEGIGDGLFGTGANITRQDMALMLYRMLRDAGISTSSEEYAFTDKDSIADYAAEAVYALKNMGIINGDTDGSFRPTGLTTRAEAAVLLYKTLDKLGKITR